MSLSMSVLAFGLSLVSSGFCSPSYPLFSYPLPIPPTATPFTTVNVDGQSIDYYETTIEPFSKQVFPGLGNASFVGYNGIAPGATYYVQKGQQTVVRYHNTMTNNASTHLHGSDTHSPWDGWSDDLVMPGQFKDYYYPNDHAARAMWYHDHAEHTTAVNAYMGLGGIWIIQDSQEKSLNLPSGKYDIPLAITDRTYDDNGGLVVPTSEGQNQYGDVVEVNAQPWPFMVVEPRKYRLRLFDLSVSRPWDLYIADAAGDWIEFPVIASDCGLFGAPVYTKDVQIAPAERYEIIFDFSPYAGQNLTMGNAMGTGPDNMIPAYTNTDKVMQFIVGDTVSDSSNNGAVPSILNPSIEWPESTTAVSQTFNFQVGGDDRWTINGVDFDDVNNRVLARPSQGSTELWKVNYAGGPGIHPVHVHLISFQIISRTGGTRGVLPYEAAGLKDVVNLEPGESAEILAVYGPWNGLYIFHCHNLIHEDSMMMAVFNVTQLEGQGYNVSTDYPDPMDPRFAPQYVSDNTWDKDQISSTVSFLGQLHAYDTTYTGSVSTSPPWSVSAESTQVVTSVAAWATTTDAADSEPTSTSYGQGSYGSQNWDTHAQNYGTQAQTTQAQYTTDLSYQAWESQAAQAHESHGGQNYSPGQYDGGHGGNRKRDGPDDNVPLIVVPVETAKVVTKVLTTLVKETLHA